MVEKYGDMVYRIALSRSLDKNNAEDIFQEVFLELVNSCEKLKNEEHMKYWLIRTTINKCISHNRRMRFRTESDIVDDDVLDDTSLSELKMIIEDLPQKYRDVIFLCCCEGYTVKEAARILRRREGTVKSQLFRAKMLLKKEMEE
ncbi:MAG: RNA polymerase sigma factor [Oscillospiraceae bacterium]